MAQVKALAWIIAAALALPAAVSAQDAVALDAQARARMGEGDATAAIRLMREHVANHPDDQAAVLDLARYLTWNGDYAAAMRVLDAAPQARDGTDGQQVRAMLLAWAGRVDAAQAANAPLLQQAPEALLPNYTQAIALRQTARPRAALPYVEAVEQARPGSRDATDLARATRIRTDSFVALDVQHGEDSDDLGRWTPALRAEVAQGEAIRYTAELGRWRYTAPLSSPFVAIDGARSVAEDRALVGVRYAPGLRTTLGAAVGVSNLDGDGETLWRLSLDQRASDSWRFGLLADHDRFAASPRALSLGIDRTGLAGSVHWTPDLLWTGDLWLRRDHYGDGNDSLAVNAAVRRAVVRAPRFLLDLGGAVEHQHFDEDPGDGYYAPDNYRRFAATASAYASLGDNAGLSLQLGLGRQRDENFASWRRANDIAVALVFGIYSPWQLGLNAAYSERVQMTGAYTGRSWGMTLTRRF
ncbi:MAG TPA: tetratricopeptide repeat protein [Xanthomonadaceae bacterium]|nr:tetratricopeptide repeat protein [Xanthomonadaceae bacterium]